MDMQIVFGILIAAVALIALVKKLSSGHYGALHPNLATTQAYLAFRVDPEMRYYLSGSDLYPNAIIGIKKSWTLVSDLWKPIELDPGKLQELIFNIKSQGLGTGDLPYGYGIFDDRGGMIGDWFSLPGQNITVWLKGGNRVEISTPGVPSPER